MALCDIFQLPHRGMSKGSILTDICITSLAPTTTSICMHIYVPTRVVVNHVFKALEGETGGDVVPAVVQSVDAVVLYDPVLY